MRKHFLILSLLLCCALGVRAQDNLPMADYKTVHFGFTLGMNFADFGFTPSNLEIDGKVYKADVSIMIPGFTVGVIGDVRMGNYFNFRLIPTFHLTDRTIYYSNNVDDEIITTSVKSTMIAVPGYIKFSGPRIRNARPYLIAGGGVMFDLGRDRQQPVLLKMLDYFVDFGAGCTIYLKYFRLSPEIKYSIGFNNVLEPWEARQNDVIAPTDDKFTLAISKLTSRMLTICLNFE